jgi:hypothetical protein
VSKGSNIRPRDVPREIYESNWDRIFRSQKAKGYKTKKKTTKSKE